MYLTRKLSIGSSEQLDILALAAGDLYSNALTYFWRIVRRKDKWLSPGSMEKIWNCKKMHAHSADAVIQTIFDSLSSWRVRRELDPKAQPPRGRRKYYRMQWKNSAIKIKDGMLVLSNGRGTKPLIIPWKWEMPVLVNMVHNGSEYVLHATYVINQKNQPLGDLVAAIDLGEVHPGVAHDGTAINGRLLRSFKRQRNKTLGHFQKLRSTKTKGSLQDRKLAKAQKRQLKKLDNQINDITHKQTTLLVSILFNKGVQTVVIGDIRDIRLHGKNLGKKSNQKIHQMSHGAYRHQLTYKAEMRGMKISLINEAYTSQDCPRCNKRTKPKGRNYKCSCGFEYHRDGVGAINILKKYRGESRVAGAMASPISLRYDPHMRCSL